VDLTGLPDALARETKRMFEMSLEKVMGCGTGCIIKFYNHKITQIFTRFFFSSLTSSYQNLITLWF